MAFQDRLAEAMRESGLTQVQVAEKCDASQAAVSGWLRGMSEPRRPVYDKLLDIFPTLRDNRDDVSVAS